MSAFNMAFKSLGRRKGRTALTVSGIIVGIAMTFIFLSMVSGMEVQTSEMVRALFGADMIINNATRLTRQQIAAGAINTLDESVITTIEGIDGIYATSSQFSRGAPVEDNDTAPARTGINGIDPPTHSVVTGGLNIIEGSSLQEGATNEVVLGKAIADYLNTSLGSNVTFNGVESFEIVGIHETGIPRQDLSCYITLVEAQSLFNKTGAITSLLVKVMDPNEVETVQTAITNLIPDVNIVSPTAAIQRISTMLNTVRMFLFSIGLVALIGGSFGVVNTMTTSITERTKEIGTLKAIGAKDGQILKIFLVEALMLGVIGGVVGVSIGIVLSGNLPSLTGGLSAIPLPGLGGRLGNTSIAPAILPSNILLCVSLGIVVGLIAGIYPAWRAARMRPVEALRHV
jgi:putative ABC transport system permease protein